MLFQNIKYGYVILLFMVRSFLQVAGWNSQFDTVRKIVVITTRLLSDAHRYILRCLSTHQNVCRCTIYTSISEVHVINLYTNNFRNLTFFPVSMILLQVLFTLVSGTTLMIWVLFKDWWLYSWNICPIYMCGCSLAIIRSLSKTCFITK